MTRQVKALNVAIVGGGHGCKAIMDMIFAEKLNQLRMKLIGVASKDIKGVGYRYAEEMGIFTTNDYRDLYKLKGLNMIIELTGREEVANGISKTKPEYIRFMDYAAARVFWDVFQIQEEWIAERKRTEETIKVAYAELSQIFNTAVDGMRVIDKDFNVLKNSQTFLTLSGVSESEASGRKCYEVFFGNLCHSPKCPLTRIMGGEERVVCEVEKERSDGTKTPCILTATPFRELDGQLIGIVEDFRNITERRRAEERLKETMVELERSNAELQQFAYVASHDLQEPVRKIQAFGDRLKVKYAELLDERGLDYLDRMQNAAIRMQTLIDDLLTLSRITSKAKPFVPVNLADVVKEVVSDLELHIEKSGGGVEVYDMPTIDADPTQMRQLLQNLINNGLKFHHPDNKPVVKVHGKLLNEICQMIVEDNGIGFDEKYLDRIFTVFQRLHGRGDYDGTGVGLAICQKIAERHGGSITAKSTPGQGAKFIVKLPVRHLRRGEESNERAKTAYHHPVC